VTAAAGGRLPPCPSSPNCVCSDDPTAWHRIDPLRLRVDAAQAWAALDAVLRAMPRTTIVHAGADRLQAECHSRLFGFVDDVVFELRPADGVIAVRSAARLGWGDLGVNRRRVETIRARLRERGVAE
jgi:uncharacterized protein (DUF1499 family)